MSKNDKTVSDNDLKRVVSAVNFDRRDYEQKDDFYQAITHDMAYLEALELLIKAQQRILVGQQKSQSLNISRIRVEHFDSLAKHAIQKQLIADKYHHYKEIFCPNFDMKMKTAVNRWDKLISDSLSLIELGKSKGILNDISTHLEMIIDEANGEVSRFKNIKGMDWIIRSEYLPKINSLKIKFENSCAEKNKG